MSRRDRLGKGLGALLGEYLEPEAAAGEVVKLALSSIVPNPAQPRRVFTDAELEDLASSIRENGLLQPLVVRPAPDTPDRFQLIAGERRFRAVSQLGWTEVPTLVREASDETLLVLALVENLQREALNPIEEAEGYQALAERFEMTQGDIAKAVGKNRSTVANLLRLLKLPPSIRQFVEGGELSMGHARALLALDDNVRAGELARRAAADGWSVREMERRVDGATKKPKKPAKATDPVVRELEQALQDRLDTRVTIHRKRGDKGTIEIQYLGAEDFERVFELIHGKRAAEVLD